MGIRWKVGFCLGVALSLAACQREHRNRSVRMFDDASAAGFESAAVG